MTRYFACLKKLDIPYITIDASKDIESIYRRIVSLIDII